MLKDLIIKCQRAVARDSSINVSDCTLAHGTKCDFTSQRSAPKYAQLLRSYSSSRCVLIFFFLFFHFFPFACHLIGNVSRAILRSRRSFIYCFFLPLYEDNFVYNLESRRTFIAMYHSHCFSRARSNDRTS